MQETAEGPGDVDTPEEAIVSEHHADDAVQANTELKEAEFPPIEPGEGGDAAEPDQAEAVSLSGTLILVASRAESLQPDAQMTEGSQPPPASEATETPVVQTEESAADQAAQNGESAEPVEEKPSTKSKKSSRSKEKESRAKAEEREKAKEAEKEKEKERKKKG